MEKKVTLILAGLLFLGAAVVFAAEPVKKECALKRISSIEKRGVMNLLTSPCEVVATFKTEKKNHPKAWPYTYIPRIVANTAIRWSSSANDIFILPWYAATGDATPLTRRFDLPDYAWEKE